MELNSAGRFLLRFQHDSYFVAFINSTSFSSHSSLVFAYTFLEMRLPPTLVVNRPVVILATRPITAYGRNFASDRQSALTYVPECGIMNQNPISVARRQLRQSRERQAPARLFATISAVREKRIPPNAVSR